MYPGSIIDSFGYGRFQISTTFKCGFVQMADAMEMLLLSVLGPHLQCTWLLSPAKAALLTTGVFFGMTIGAVLIGFMADKFGRKLMLLFSSLGVAYFGFISVFMTTFTSLLITRTLVGLWIGGVISTNIPLLLEFTPSNRRALSASLMLLCWGIGNVMETVVAYLIMPTLGWRWLLFFTAIPPLIAGCLLFTLDESPRFLLLSRQEKDARKVLDDIAVANDRPLYRGEILQTSHNEMNQGNFKDLWHPKYRFTFLLSCYMWLAIGFSYYGMYLLVTTLSTITADRCPSFYSALYISDNSCCNELTTQTFMSLLVASLGEIFTFPVVMLSVEILGRRWALICLNFGLLLIFVLSTICAPLFVTNGIFFVGRCLGLSVFNVAILYTSEVFPTSVRNLAVGMCSSCARIGAMLTPFVAQVVVLNYSPLAAQLIYATATLIGAVAAFLLPYETKDAQLQETVMDIEPDEKNFNEFDSVVKSSQQPVYDSFKKE